MKLTAFTDYSLRVLIYLAANTDRRATIAEISLSFGISESHLTKVVHLLGKNGWITTVRGKGGGITLAMPAEAIGVGAVIRSAEGATMPAECFDSKTNQCVIARCCRLKGVLAEAVDAFYAALDRYTLADIAGNRQKLAEIMFVTHSAVP